MTEPGKPFIRFELGRSGKFWMCVLVMFDKDGSAREIKFSQAYWPVHNYVNKRNSTQFIIFDLMFRKDSAKYTSWIKKIKKISQQKIENNNNLTTKTK